MSVQKKSKFPITFKDTEMVALVKKTNQKILAVWAIDCAERVIHYFEEKFPKDQRPRNALKTLQIWIDTRIFKMSVIRKVSLDSHAAARGAEEHSPARSAARACGQAVATAHVPTHSLGSALYAQQAIHYASTPEDAAAA